MKAQVDPPKVVVAVVLLLLVLLVLMFIFGRQGGNFFAFLDRTDDVLEQGHCEAPLLGRMCKQLPCREINDEYYEYEPATPPPGGWDCKEKHSDAPYCCNVRPKANIE